MFLPTTWQEVTALGWKSLDVIIVTGDSYIDSPFNGAALIGKILVAGGYRVGIIAQPDTSSPTDVTRLGEPGLFWGVTAGSIDSMVANYTAGRKKRRFDDHTPGGINNRRPDRASIVYTNLIRRAYKNTAPIVLGGIEASLRRVAHFDYWSNRIRRSLLVDAKADYLLYGMAEGSVLELAACLKRGDKPAAVRGLSFVSKEKKEGYVDLPAFEEVAAVTQAFINMFHTFYHNNDPLTARGLQQRHGDRYVVQNPPSPYPSQKEMDRIYALDFERAHHPHYESLGSVRALETIQFALSTHRGCYGECNFCAIAVHEGRTVRWRSTDSIVEEAKRLVAHPDFKGMILDVGGPTANMYGYECTKKLTVGSCTTKRCIFPKICDQLKVDHATQIDLLHRIRSLPGVKKVFVASGLRYDLVLADREHGLPYLRELTRHHVSGQLKIAPEHTDDKILQRMGKPSSHSLIEFKDLFDQLSAEAGKQQFLTYYFIAAYPGCSEEEMFGLRKFTATKLKIHPEQVQIFTPTPSTYASLMYYTETDPFTGQKLFVEKDTVGKERQKRVLTTKVSPAIPWRTRRGR